MENSWRCSVGGIAKQIEYFFTLPLFLGIYKSRMLCKKSFKLINYILICLFLLPFFQENYSEKIYEWFISHCTSHNHQFSECNLTLSRKSEIYKNMERKQQRRKLRKNDAIAIGELRKVHALHCIIFSTLFFTFAYVMNKNVLLSAVLLLKQIASRFSLTRLTKAIVFFFQHSKWKSWNWINCLAIKALSCCSAFAYKMKKKTRNKREKC